MLYTGVGQVSTTFKADSRRNLVSALAKLYPSPDWNVGVDRINLCDGNCSWKRTIVKDLYPWDAGNEDEYIKFVSKVYRPQDHLSNGIEIFIAVIYQIMNNKQRNTLGFCPQTYKT